MKYLLLILTTLMIQLVHGADILAPWPNQTDLEKAFKGTSAKESLQAHRSLRKQFPPLLCINKSNEPVKVCLSLGSPYHVVMPNNTIGASHMEVCKILYSATNPGCTTIIVREVDGKYRALINVKKEQLEEVLSKQ